jgi:murein DD-endopeptidase MepM/ murein hydrolase activator NlpD
VLKDFFRFSPFLYLRRNYVWAFFALFCFTQAYALPRESRVPGGVAHVVVGEANAPAPTVKSGASPVWVVKRGAQWVAVVGIALSAKAGAQKVSVTQADGNVREVTFDIKTKAYPTQALKLAPAMVDPPKEVQERIAQERAHLASVRAAWNARESTDAVLDIPAQGRLSSRYGVRRVLNGQPRAPHAGLDVAIGTGTPIHAASDATVLDAGDYYYCGKTMFLDHGNGLLTMHCHLSEFIARVGERVKRGERIALSGGTGRATGPHLHWSVYLNGESVDPELFVPTAQLRAAEALGKK